MFKMRLVAAAIVSCSFVGVAWSPDVNAKRNVIKVDQPVEVILSSDGAGRNSTAGFKKYDFTFKQLGVFEPFQLRGIDSIYSIPFGIPADEVVTDIKLKLDFSFSPSLLTQLSHLKVLLNGEVVQVIPLPKEDAGSRLVREVAIDPKFVSDFNRLSFQFVGHYTLDCEDPFHSSLWLNLSNASSLQFTVAPLSVVNDLSLLPVPFFDRRDGRRLVRPFVFGSNPGPETLAAAGIVASWFGDLASYRGAEFPVSFNKLPVDHAVVFATAAELSDGLGIPPINGPTLSVASHPADNRFKVLYVLGRDAAELKIAATALGLGRVALGGQTVNNATLNDVKARKPYDAPRWLPSDRPVKFGEIATVEELNVRGLAPEPMRLNLTVPPDLFGWKSSGVPVKLKYRYTPRPRPDKSNLNILLNQNFLDSYPLLSHQGESQTDALLPKWIGSLSDGVQIPQSKSINLPVSQVRAKSQVQFQFSFDYPKEGACRDVVLDNARAAIDPDSEIDISRFPKYLKMPDLAAFANVGFPFTRMADLSETVVVLPDSYGEHDISVYLAMMGRMGESTGLPAYGVSVAKSSEAQKFSDKDILLIGTASTQKLYTDWAKHMPFSADVEKRTFSLADRKQKWIPWYESSDTDGVTLANLTSQTLAKDLVLFGFESPLKSGRSVVAVSTDLAAGKADISSALMDVAVVSKIQGAISVIRGNDVDAFQVSNNYYVGSLPPLMAIQWALSRNPWISALLLIVSAILLGGVMYAILRKQAGGRLKANKS